MLKSLFVSVLQGSVVLVIVCLFNCLPVCALCVCIYICMHGLQHSTIKRGIKTPAGVLMSELFFYMLGIRGSRLFRICFNYYLLNKVNNTGYILKKKNKIT